MNVPLKTSINTRLPLSLRLPRTSNSQAEQHTGFSSIHQTNESIYDVDYSLIPLNLKPEKNTEVNSPTDSGFVREGKSSDEIILESEEDVVPSQLPYKVVSSPSSRWESEAHSAARSIEPGRQTDFYSIVRKIERKHDDARVYGPNVTQRAEQIRMTRSQDPSLGPSAPEYVQLASTQVRSEIPQKRLLKNYLDIVECSHLNPRTEYQVGFDVLPKSRLPSLDFSQPFQSSNEIRTKMKGSLNLFNDTPNCIQRGIVGHTRHISNTGQNFCTMHNDKDPRAAFAKAYMTLAVAGGGVDSSVNRQGAALFRRRGRHSRGSVALKPRSDENICRTVEGSMLQQTIHRSLDSERMMNTREDYRRKSEF
ncbi:unnamed protein product [Phytomonas sp. Hart1]|nr:unnamed protein product [Phytomonas sp. Hart1]|eukprot:CCW66123.1 unnamed protein product [Phytomonas sp. isolate Hart1]